MVSQEDVVEAFCTLCDYSDLEEDLYLTFAKFVCSAYCPKGIQLSNITSKIFAGICFARTWQKMKNYLLLRERSDITF